MSRTVAIIGAGASGLAAAVSAAKSGARVVILEKNHAAGKKILASGGGRCNLTNSRLTPERYHGGSRSFIRSVLSRFAAADAVRFFEEIGLAMVEEPDGRIFTRCGRSRAVMDVFESALRRLPVEILLSREVRGVSSLGGGFEITAEHAPRQWNQREKPVSRLENFTADRVILSCGGVGYPQLGGGESGYRLAASLGHTVTPVTPSLVPLRVEKNPFKKLSGIKAEVSLEAYSGKEKIAGSDGEILFTDYGISGPAALDISREAVVSCAAGGRVRARMNLFPELTEKKLRSFLEARRARAPEAASGDFLCGLFERKMNETLLEKAGIDAARALSARDADGLAGLMGAWEFEITGPMPWSEAMASAGGVSLDEVDAKTLQSRKIPGLHLTGELLDADGDSGGFNLHFAWATGLIAGNCAGGHVE